MPVMLSTAARLLSMRLIGCVVAVALVLPIGGRAASARKPIASIAVFPVENLSGGPVPDEEIRRFFVETLASQGITILGYDELQAFMARHRVRYAAGIDGPTAEALRKEAAVDGVLFVSVELSEESSPPKVALIARLVSTDSAPTVVWSDDAGIAGDDAPGFFELGVVNDYPTVLSRALDQVSGSLVSHLKGAEARATSKLSSKFRPKSHYGHVTLEPGRQYSVAVVPFVNLSERRNAGELLALLFTRHLSARPEFRVVDAGVTRRQLLDARIIMAGGLSVTDADTVAASLEADFVLGGRVIRYQDYPGPSGTARVDFSTVLVERKSRRIAWTSNSYNDGNDGVALFGRGMSRTAHAMATQMVKLTTEMMVGRQR